MEAAFIINAFINLFFVKDQKTSFRRSENFGNQITPLSNLQ